MHTRRAKVAAANLAMLNWTPDLFAAQDNISTGTGADLWRFTVIGSDGSEAAQRAIALFTHRVVRESGAMVACMGGLDVLAFSGGIGEHDAVLRAQVCERLAWLGIALEPQLNLQATGGEVQAIHSPQSRVQVWVVPTDEGLVAAREAAYLLHNT